MLQARHLLGRIRHHALAVCGIRTGPLPRSAMMRSGVAIGAGFLLFLAFGRPQAAVICAVFTNFLCFSDRASHLVTRVWVQTLGAALFTALGAIGLLLAGHPPLILLSVFAVALVAGFVHGSSPGMEALPRFGLCCLVAAAFLPIGDADSLAAVLLGTAISLATVLLDDYARHGRRGPYIAKVRASVTYPGPRFSLIYGCAAVGSMAIGVIWGEIRPYWVTITTLLVMQPDRRANTVRVVQRFLGTVGGVVIAFAVAHAMPNPVRLQGLLALVVILPFLWPLGYDRNYALGVAVLSAWVLFLLDLALPSTEVATPLFLARLSDTSIGCAVALAGSFAVYEVREKAAG